MTFKGRRRKIALAISGLLLAAAGGVYARYRSDISKEWNRISGKSSIAVTPCGPIEYAVIGEGAPVLMVHGAGGGFDQGLDFARPLAERNLKMIVMSRFGYLRTPLPKDASAEAQADAHLCLMDALGIERAGIGGASAGAPSAMQFAIRHPDRTAALFLLVPAAYRPNGEIRSLKTPRWTDFLFDTALRSDLLFWFAIRAIPDTLTGSILATPPEVVKRAERSEQERVREMMAHILPVSPRRLGLLNDAKVTSTLTRYELERIHAPTLVISLRDDRYGTYPAARYTAGQISGARFVGYDEGGHIGVGHQREITDEAARFFQQNR